MKAIRPQPPWNAIDKAASLMDYAQWFHEQAVDMFRQDQTHGHFIFLFNDQGLASMNPVPPNTEPEQLVAGLRRAIQEHNLYGIISISEAWTYFPKKSDDHVAIQLRYNEMRVSDLTDDMKSEALMVRMESRDGDHMTLLNQIIRQDGQVRLGEIIKLFREDCLRFDSYFEG